MAPRPKKKRNCCGLGHGEHCFKPAHKPLRDCEQIILASDELTALTLCDHQDLTQQQAGEQMGVSRGTVQRLVNQARKKMITALLQGNALLLEPAGGAEGRVTTQQH
ncbi:MAG: DNA-binding protein [Desulfuromonas sp.]|nr:MAG: DNA-binding protein [Desulfuromonas sp.]